MKSLKLILFLLLLSGAVNCYAQIDEIWTQQLDEEIRWQQVTSLGHYLVGTSNGIMGINPENGQVIWSTPEFGALSSEQMRQVGSSPLVSVNLDSEVHMIDPFSGESKFNSKKAGVAEIRDQVVLYKANGVLISGKDASNKDVLLMSSMTNGEVVWKIHR